MNSSAFGLRVASAIFGIVSLCHLIRIIDSANLVVGTYYVGRRWSVVAVIVSALLCAWMWMLASKAARSNVVTPPARPAA